jgi:hypothetical protein
MNLRDFNTSRCSQGPSRACHSVARARSLGPAGCRTRQPTSTPERGWWSPSGFGARLRSRIEVPCRCSWTVDLVSVKLVDLFPGTGPQPSHSSNTFWPPSVTYSR